jgi:chitin disaccharide deacetylase
VSAERAVNVQHLGCTALSTWYSAPGAKQISSGHQPSSAVFERSLKDRRNPPEPNAKCSLLLDWRVRRLIVNADDFGLTQGVNRAIVEAHCHGIVTSATLMANGQAFDDAIQRAKSTSRLSVGCHVVLVDGLPVLGRRQTPTLSDKQAQDGRFHESLIGFALRAVSGSIDADEIEAETIAQIRRLQATGVAVSHLDTHKHTHIFPPVLRPLLRAARACGVPAVRNPFGPVHVSILAKRPSLWKQYSKVTVLSRLGRTFRRSVAGAGMLAPDGTVGIVTTGAMDDRLFGSIVDSLPEGTWELVCHPGYNDAELGSIRTRLRESRAVELRLLTSPEAREILARSGVQLISYRDLV